MDWIDTLHDDIRRSIKDRSISYPTKQYANHRLQQIRPDLREVSDEGSYQDFLLRYLQKEQERFRLHRSEDTEERLAASPYEETRDQPVCTCGGRRGHACPLKRGELPREVRRAEDLDHGIREFRGSHSGNPVVLEDAQEEWAQRLATVEHELRDILAVLAADEIPDDADWQPTTAAP